MYSFKLNRSSFSIELLQKTGLPHTGKKEELIGQLVKHDETKALELESLEAEFGNLDDFDEAKLNLDELADPDLKSFQPEDEEKPLESILASNATNTIPTNSSTTTSQEPITKEGSGFKFEPIVFDKKQQRLLPVVVPLYRLSQPRTRRLLKQNENWNGQNDSEYKWMKKRNRKYGQHDLDPTSLLLLVLDKHLSKHHPLQRASIRKFLGNALNGLDYLTRPQNHQKQRPLYPLKKKRKNGSELNDLEVMPTKK
ncbi:unnamed protein product [Absidia cylindrospora]